MLSELCFLFKKNYPSVKIGWIFFVYFDAIIFLYTLARNFLYFLLLGSLFEL